LVLRNKEYKISVNYNGPMRGKRTLSSKEKKIRHIISYVEIRVGKDWGKTMGKGGLA